MYMQIYIGSSFVPQLILENAIGLTSANNQSLAINRLSGAIAYTAGSVVPVLDIYRNAQTHFYSSFMPDVERVSALPTLGSMPASRTMKEKRGKTYANFVRPISCLVYSEDGAYLAAGEVLCE
jgi:hypothetical protein